MRRFVLGDLHGGHKALMQVFARSAFNPEEDKLILLGDLCDGWPETRQCIDELLKVKNLVFVRGNHDQWFMDWMHQGQQPERYERIWYTQGGEATIESYLRDTHSGAVAPHVPQSHVSFFNSSVYAYEEDGDLFVHGGVRPDLDLSVQIALYNQDLMWDRHLVSTAYFDWKRVKPQKYGHWNRIFVGHTSIKGTYKLDTPTTMGNVVAMDTGGGWEGWLSLMDIDTGEYVQSDLVSKLYPNVKGRYG